MAPTKPKKKNNLWSVEQRTTVYILNTRFNYAPNSKTATLARLFNYIWREKLEKDGFEHGKEASVIRDDYNSRDTAGRSTMYRNVIFQITPDQLRRNEDALAVIKRAVADLAVTEIEEADENALHGQDGNDGATSGAKVLRGVASGRNDITETRVTRSTKAKLSTASIIDLTADSSKAIDLTGDESNINDATSQVQTGAQPERKKKIKVPRYIREKMYNKDVISFAGNKVEISIPGPTRPKGRYQLGGKKVAGWKPVLGFVAPPVNEVDSDDQADFDAESEDEDFEMSDDEKKGKVMHRGVDKTFFMPLAVPMEIDRVQAIWNDLAVVVKNIKDENVDAFPTGRIEGEVDPRFLWVTNIIYPSDQAAAFWVGGREHPNAAFPIFQDRVRSWLAYQKGRWGEDFKVDDMP